MKKREEKRSSAGAAAELDMHLYYNKRSHDSLVSPRVGGSFSTDSCLHKAEDLFKADFELSRIFHEKVFCEGVRSVATAGNQGCNL